MNNFDLDDVLNDLNFNNLNNSNDNSNIDYTNFFRGLISHHGFASNDGPDNGFSCYIKDPDRTIDGTMIWVYRPAHSQIETELQKYCSAQRINKINSLGFKKEKYISLMPDITDRFIEEFKNSNLKFNRIGGGIGKKDNKGFFGRSGYFNHGIDFLNFAHGDYEFYKRFELFTINNSIVKVWEQIKWFKCLNRDNLFVDKFFSKDND